MAWLVRVARKLRTQAGRLLQSKRTASRIELEEGVRPRKKRRNEAPSLASRSPVVGIEGGEAQIRSSWCSKKEGLRSL